MYYILSFIMIIFANYFLAIKIGSYSTKLRFAEFKRLLQFKLY